MGRLNYTNRKIDGVKLGQVVAKDLTKRIPPALGSKAALRDPVVEIDLRSKQLTDAGLLEVTAGLVKSIETVTVQGRVVLLDELCLKDNGLTVASLSGLTSIMDLVCNDLRDLDLSDNTISVNDPDDVIPWENFLRSLSKCCVLRRLDLSGNDLGTKAFEVLARVYAKEGPIDLMLPEEYAGVATLKPMAQSVTLASEFEKIDSADDRMAKAKPRKTKLSRFVPKSDERRSSSPEKSSLKASRLEQLSLYATSKGLHSVPYIVLSNTSMSDASALYLSYIIVEHQLPNYLLTRVPPAKAGLEQQQLTAYDQTQCWGVIYLPNSKMTREGVKILALAEKERLRLAEACSSNAGNEDLDDPIKATEASGQMLGTSRLSGLITARNHRRRTSGSTSGYPGSLGSSAKSMSDLDRARSRIQGEELEKTGQYGNDLWRIALNMLCLCREIQLPSRREPPEASQCLPRVDLDPDPDSSLTCEFHPPLPQSPPKPRAPIIKILEVPGFHSRKIKPLAPHLPLGNGNPNQAMSPRSTHKRKPSALVMPETPTVIPPTPLAVSPGIKVAIAAALAKAKPYRSKLPCGFSQEMWRRILGQAAGAQGIMSQLQQKSVLAWAMDRHTLRRGREWLGEKEGNQIWHVLDRMGCLAYEVDKETDAW